MVGRKVSDGVFFFSDKDVAGKGFLGVSEIILFRFGDFGIKVFRAIR